VLQHFGWDLYLLVASLAFVWIAVRGRVRGMGYAGAIGLLTFALSAGVRITRTQTGLTTTSSIVGWPLALMLLGVAGLVASALAPRRSA
jgi:hypothetical protein